MTKCSHLEGDAIVVPHFLVIFSCQLYQSLYETPRGFSRSQLSGLQMKLNHSKSNQVSCFSVRGTGLCIEQESSRSRVENQQNQRAFGVESRIIKLHVSQNFSQIYFESLLFFFLQCCLNFFNAVSFFFLQCSSMLRLIVNNYYTHSPLVLWVNSP